MDGSSGTQKAAAAVEREHVQDTFLLLVWQVNKQRVERPPLFLAAIIGAIKPPC